MDVEDDVRDSDEDISNFSQNEYAGSMVVSSSGDESEADAEGSDADDPET